MITLIQEREQSALIIDDSPDQWGEVFTHAYTRLHHLAHLQRRRWSGCETLGTTVLVHEAYLKLARSGSAKFNDPEHFLCSAARAMRQILVNYAERQTATKRGGGADHQPLDGTIVIAPSRVEECLAIHQALEQLARTHPRRAAVFECRVFGAMTNPEIATALGISLATVKRDWQLASMVVYRDLQGEARSPGSSTATGG